VRWHGYRVFLAGCNALLPGPKTIDCPPLPDANQTLAQAWQAYQPGQPMSLPVTVRRRLFAFQALLLSAGMYQDQPPGAPSSVYADYAPQFVRDLGMSRNPGLGDALKNLDRKLDDVRQDPESKLAGNCGLILARRALREDPTNVSTDWILQTVTWGLRGLLPEQRAPVDPRTRADMQRANRSGRRGRSHSRLRDTSSRPLAPRLLQNVVCPTSIRWPSGSRM
jgi:hypothetical protein